MDKKSMLQAVVHDVVLAVAKKRGPITDVKNGDKLVDLGLQSLDLAQIVAKLEMRTGLDPFMDLVSITSVRTVGDLWAAYVSATNGATLPSSDGDVSAGLERAARRRNLVKT